MQINLNNEKLFFIPAYHAAIDSEVELVKTNSRKSKRPKVLVVTDDSKELIAIRNALAGVECELQVVPYSKKNQIDIEESERKLDQIFNESPATLAILMGPDHICEKVNKRFLELTGTNESILGHPLREIFKDSSQTRIIETVKYVYRTGKPLIGNETPLDFVRPNGVRLQGYVDYIYQPLKNVEGQVYGVVIQSFDVTEKVLARQAAERANRLKSSFLANMSHEIRTPLGAMLGFADLLRQSDLSEDERKNYLDILIRNGESLAVIIDDILDLSKVEAGHLNLELTEVYPRNVAEEAIMLLKVKAREKGLKLDLIIDPSTPTKMFSDATRMRQILINLIGNAIKFTQSGSVTVRSFGALTKSDRPGVGFEVTDTGIGIPQSQREKIFEMFAQADDSTTRRFGGTGLGLALSRSLARSMGGDVEITRAVVGKGTTFLVTLEDRCNKRREMSDEESSEKGRRFDGSDRPLDHVKVLVIDDSPDNRKLISIYLEKEGAEVDSADNGMDGYEMAMHGDYNVILMDIQMPEMDGYEATRKLRDAGYDKPIIALTAHAMNQVRDKILEVGANTHLSKPIDFKTLTSTISGYL